MKHKMKKHMAEAGAGDETSGPTKGPQHNKQETLAERSEKIGRPADGPIKIKSKWSMP